MLEGSTAIVTGAGRGIGRAEALALAARGARVVVNDVGGSLLGAGADEGPAHQVVEEIRAAGGEAVAHTGDVSSWDDARGLVARAVDTFGGLDIVVNNAGVIRTGMSFNTAEADWDLVVDVHLKGTYAVSRFAGEYWRTRAKQRGGPVPAAVVNTSSPNGLNGGVPGHVSYAVAKSGIATMTIVMARELAPYGVRCNAIAPVAFTRMTEELWGEGMFADENRGLLSPEGIAAVVTWLASPLTAQVSGQVLGVTGGECLLWESWQPVSSVRRATAWTVEALEDVRGELFGGRDTGVPVPAGGTAEGEVG